MRVVLRPDAGEPLPRELDLERGDLHAGGVETGLPREQDEAPEACAHVQDACPACEQRRHHAEPVFRDRIAHVIDEMGPDRLLSEHIAVERREIVEQFALLARLVGRLAGHGGHADRGRWPRAACRFVTF